MNNPEHLNYSVDKNRLRIGAALGVIVITAGFALGSVMNTSSSSADEPISSEIDSTTAADETTVTGNGSDQDSDNATSTANDQPVADKGSVANETNETDAENTDAENTDAENTDAENTDAENTDAENTDAENTDAENTDAENTDAENTDAENTDETDSNEGNDSGLSWDFGLVFPGDIIEELIDPLPLPDDLDPIGPINPPSPPSPPGPINPPSPPGPINPPSPIGYDTGPIGTPSPIDPLIQMWSELSGHIN